MTDLHRAGQILQDTVQSCTERHPSVTSVALWTSVQLCPDCADSPGFADDVGGHISRTFPESDAPDECIQQSVGDNPCGFCGLDNHSTQLLEKKGGGITITSNCQYHYVQMQYRAATKFSRSSPCTNVPIHCPICPTSVSKAPQTIWKYNALFHLLSEHATGSTPPQIPRQTY